jgi:hypothetical protein
VCRVPTPGGAPAQPGYLTALSGTTTPRSQRPPSGRSSSSHRAALPAKNSGTSPPGPSTAILSTCTCAYLLDARQSFEALLALSPMGPPDKARIGPWGSVYGAEGKSVCDRSGTRAASPSPGPLHHAHRNPPDQMPSVIAALRQSLGAGPASAASRPAWPGRADLELTRHDVRGWRATFAPERRIHSATRRTRGHPGKRFYRPRGCGSCGRSIRGWPSKRTPLARERVRQDRPERLVGTAWGPSAGIPRSSRRSWSGAGRGAASVRPRARPSLRTLDGSWRLWNGNGGSC